MTTVASAVFNVRGYKDRYTSYVIEVRNPTVDFGSGTISVDVWTGKREGNSAIVQEANYSLAANGTEIASLTDADFTGTSSSLGKAVTISGPIDTSQSSVRLTLTTVLPAWDDATEEMGFSVDIPQPVTSDDLSVSCSVSPPNVAPGESVTVSGTVENSGDGAASVDVTVAAGDVSETERLEIAAGGTGTVEVEFELPVGTYTPTVSASVV